MGQEKKIQSLYTVANSVLSPRMGKYSIYGKARPVFFFESLDGSQMMAGLGPVSPILRTFRSYHIVSSQIQGYHKNMSHRINLPGLIESDMTTRETVWV